MLSHEFLHRWGAGMKFGASDGSLWSYLLDFDGSVL